MVFEEDGQGQFYGLVDLFLGSADEHDVEGADYLCLEHSELLVLFKACQHPRED